MRKSVEIKLFIPIELDRRLDQFVEGTRPGVILAEGDVVEDIEGLDIIEDIIGHQLKKYCQDNNNPEAQVGSGYTL